MEHCRFENTAADLEDCKDHLDDKLDNEYEIRGRKRLLALCKEIAANWGDDDGE